MEIVVSSLYPEDFLKSKLEIMTKVVGELKDYNYAMKKCRKSKN